jgi:hypothetical protein
MYSDRPSVFATANDPASRGEKFLEEALKLWALEEGKITLVNLQSLLILSIGSVLLINSVEYGKSPNM